jgi:hypothetical protein
MNLGAPELIISLGLVPLAFVLWAVIDAASRPDWAWQQASQNKTVWVVVPAVRLFVCGIVGLVMAIVSIVSIRPQVVRAQHGGGL